MFLAELAYNTVEEEIKDLELKQNRRDESLEMSQDELEKDNIDLIQFIHHDNSLKLEKEQKERREQQKKQEREDQLKQFDAKIQTVKSEIEKNRDQLNGLKDYQDFIIQLSEPAFLKKREKEMQAKEEHCKRSWINQYKHDRSLDHIIFKDDEEIHGDIRFELLSEQQQTTGANFGASVGAGGNRRTGGTRTDIRERMTERDWENRFNQLMSLHLIDVPDDYYKDELQFKDHNQLKSIFNKLEQDNLKKISQMQENEQLLEALVLKEN